MARCVRCGRRGLFLRLSSEGYCADCQAYVDNWRAEQAAKAAEQAARDAEREAREAERNAKIQAERAARTKRGHEEFCAELASIPLVSVGLSGEKQPYTPLDGYYELKYSNVTRRSSKDTLGGYISIDVETTGLKANCSIIEISAIRFEDYIPIAHFTTLINPGRAIPPDATRVNHITDEMVHGAPTIWQVVPSLQEFIGSSPLVGHNLPFDLKFLCRVGLQVQPRQKLFDTLEIAKQVLKRADKDGISAYDVENYKLQTVCGHYGIYYFAFAHRASGDALATGKLFERLVNDRTK